MSGAQAAPAGLLRRYAAWSLDMAVPGLAVLMTCAAHLRGGIARIAAAFDAVVQAMARSMLDLLVQGGSPLALARQWLSDPDQHALVRSLSQAIGDTLLLPLLAWGVLALLWFVAWEASPCQATPGKRALGLRTCAVDGARIGIARAAGRHLAGILSWLTLNIGHLLAATPPHYQALHDRIAGTHVRQPGGRAALPAWAKAWLAAQCVATLAVAIWLFVATQAAMQRALDALLP